jgi:hypothetical protein
LEASLTNIRRENQALDVTNAANVLQSLQHGNRGYTGVAAPELPLGYQLQPSLPASIILEQCSEAEYGGAPGEASDLSCSEPDQQYFPGHLGVLLDGQANGFTSDGLALVDQVSGIAELESQQLPVADGLFLSNFMQEYRETM